MVESLARVLFGAFFVVARTKLQISSHWTHCAITANVLIVMGERDPRGIASSALVRVNCAAPAAQWTFDHLAPAALATFTAEATEHLIEDVLAVPRSMAFWAGQFAFAVAIWAGAFRHGRCAFLCFALCI